MNLTYYPFQVITTRPSLITVIDTAVPKVFLDLLRTLRDDNGEIVVSDDKMQIQEAHKACLWVGDPALELDLDKLLQRWIYKKIAQMIDDQRLVKLIDQSQHMAMDLLKDPLLNDLPLTVEPGGKLEQIMKYCNLHFDEGVTVEPVSKIEAAIQTLTKLEEKRLVILTNVSHYLGAKEWKHLVDQVSDTTLELALIEFSDVERKNFFENCQYVYIDEDFMDSRELID
ncbi:type II-A CRISPR-associated protein Csn2 [Lacticaseibacillus zeae]|uniref:Type II-A CRISPR-associated protein Csn2 n=1 Tax=Lacticaseibacillus zeae subsp. silagei TaxID=3068307 RepID=A0ABD7Z7M0_LACZE|nr:MULTISPECIES: type II-A CRISPR-associated protein Csn2 [Lacticaseibacillus]MDE3315872.1 type II-A CRISPR-associated protein Csn2 [Lacticaseibacillus zeae]OFR93798.1 type II-A CRISPR-associated protein Csn2 [Lactobacillus sp. HMSC068F07]WLV82920.1 type II-A CRISPR-associated protein Csn2 [Lacticaseibacillus sp. NCIMB 15475]WLV85668.1 type II-A CRISPR-associated protein Csn2 [Lacticaseibacillus sp. NCIMB 15474]